MVQDVECPYCGQWQEINHDGGYGYGEEDIYNQECKDCNKNFVYETAISYSYLVEQAPCLNGKAHFFRETVTYPLECTKMRCIYCDEKREPTKDEWNVILKCRS